LLSIRNVARQCEDLSALCGNFRRRRIELYRIASRDDDTATLRRKPVR
jgi:hypothetical protein